MMQRRIKPVSKLVFYSVNRYGYIRATNKTRQCLQNSLAKQSASSVFGSCRQTRLWHAEEDVKRMSEETYHLVSKRFDISLQEWEALETAKTSLEAETKQLMANLQDKEKVVILLRVSASTVYYSHSDSAPSAPSQTPDHPCVSCPRPVGACGGLEFLKNGLCLGLQSLEEKIRVSLSCFCEEVNLEGAHWHVVS